MQFLFRENLYAKILGSIFFFSDFPVLILLRDSGDLGSDRPGDIGDMGSDRVDMGVMGDFIVLILLTIIFQLNLINF